MASGIICRNWADLWVNKCNDRNHSRRLSVTTIICVGFTPLSMVLRRVKAGYDLASRKGLLNNISFMADLKLYGKNKKQVDALINTVRVFSSDIAMEFGIN